MDDQLNACTQNRMRALCSKISVAHDLDPEIREELYGHMEDKLLAYLNGEEPVTEDDAYILVREHFGDPAVLKGLLQDVHAYEVHGNLARRLAAASIVSTCGIMAFYAIWAGLMYLDGHMNSIFREAFMWTWGTPSALSILISITSIAALAALPWIVLRKWDRRSADGQTLWFMRWRPMAIAGLVAFLFFIQSVVQVLDAGAALDSMCNVLGQDVEWIVCGIVMIVCPVSVCLAWLWWCDRPPWSLRTAARTVGVWLIWFMLCWVRIDVNGMRNAEPSFNSLYLLRMFVGYVIPTVFFTVVTGLLACSLYAVARRARRRYALRASGEVAND